MIPARTHPTAPSTIALSVLVLAATGPMLALAHGSDMQMDMNMSNSSTATMGTSFSTTIGSSQLWFDGWIPTTSASTAGACIGLALLAILSRFLATVRTSCEANWTQSILRQRLAQHQPLVDATLLNTVPTMPSRKGELDVASDPSDKAQARSELADLLHKFHSSPAPFTPSIDLPRTAIFAIELLVFRTTQLQAFIGYLLMLAIMTYSAWFFISIISGLALGELLFGRFINSHGHSSDLGLHH
ncbi:BZ3500_MvSof-1268-A1-R1_Chr1-1g01023 [Microbotryum saponariae]|uniref:Copper transport protein n=1 Tax=Microbotryum saponariae TaxID=289078 RepID=A0A2X0L3B9_9BASI|nr:BZ3500_MvSof-1268-A1-R1_Chr1-1g01023 [Microbotryum saponariae]SCZ93211.1 BZ3501_MvSof-1269-A2-R1_Chr1-1g00620 [Microbotryum saponariae]